MTQTASTNQTLSSKLDEIVARKRREVSELKATDPYGRWTREAKETAYERRDFAAALRSGTPLAVIAEIKRASPSAGTINADFDPLEVASSYAAAGASALSILTDEPDFGGHVDILRAVRSMQAASGQPSPPILRKDFLIDEAQLWESVAIGADAVLLIAECLPGEQLRDMHQAALGMGLQTLIELYDAANLDRVLACDPGVVGVNNRDLQTFSVDIGHSRRLRKAVPPSVVFVSESGLKTRDDTAPLIEAGVDAILVGETLMRSADIGATMRELRGM